MTTAYTPSSINSCSLVLHQTNPFFVTLLPELVHLRQRIRLLCGVQPDLSHLVPRSQKSIRYKAVWYDYFSFNQMIIKWIQLICLISLAEAYQPFFVFWFVSHCCSIGRIIV